MQLYHPRDKAAPIDRKEPLPSFLLRLAAIITFAVLALSVSLMIPLKDPQASMLTPVDPIPVPDQNFGTAPSGLEAQISITGSLNQINVEAFNKQRTKDITEDSRKLVALAKALKAELDGNGGERPSDVVKKISQIEKLARDVKSRMQVNPLLGPI